MDYRAANDHPINVLNANAAEAFKISGPEAEYGRAYSTAATRLYGYELENDVTFAALDNETLRALVDAYENEDEWLVKRLVGDLLGLND